jgi:hypothetical protein
MLLKGLLVKCRAGTAGALALPAYGISQKPLCSTRAPGQPTSTSAMARPLAAVVAARVSVPTPVTLLATVNGVPAVTPVRMTVVEPVAVATAAVTWRWRSTRR